MFIDESGKPSETLFAIGGVAVEGARWHELRTRWWGALSAHGWPEDREVKWHGIQTGDVPPPLADDLFAVLAAAPITCFVVVVRTGAARKVEPGLVDSP